MHWTNVAHKMRFHKAFLYLDKASFLRQNTKNIHICCCTTRITNNHGPRTVPCATPYNQFNRQFSITSSRSIWTPNIWPFVKDDSVPALPPDFVESAVPKDVASTSEAVTSTVSASDAVTSSVPIDPAVSEVLTGAIVDPPFVELGLACKWFPNHLVHQLLEFVHTSTDLPWWSTIVIGTCIIRIISMPLYIYTRKFAIRTNNHKEESQKMLEKVTNAQYEGSFMQQMAAKHKLKEFYKRTGTGPFKGLFVNSSMSILFITCITAVRQMCAVPVPSMTEGGILWFNDLTSPDPYYALPIITGAIIGLTINLGLKAGVMQGSTTATTVLSKLQYAPIIGMPLIFGKMYCGVYLYVMTTSAITLVMQRLLLEPRVKEMLKFPEYVQPSGGRQTFREMIREHREKTNKRTQKKMQLRMIKQARKKREKDRKNELKGKPPITYTIGKEAKFVKREKPDFERQWRPPKPKAFGLY